MKRTGRPLVLLMVIIFLASPLKVSASNLTTYDKAKVLYDLGLFSGTSNQSFSPDLDSATNREQGVKMIVSALGWSVDENKSSVFEDVSDWAQPYVVVAVESGFTNGIGLNQSGLPMFGGGNPITERQLRTWFDRVITGSDKAWEDNESLDNSRGITRGQLVEMTYDALKEIPVGENERLIEAVLGDDAERIQIAQDGGLFSDKPQTLDGTVPTVVDLAVNAEDKIIISFSEAVDSISASEEGNYLLFDNQYAQVPDFIDRIDIISDDTVMITFVKKYMGFYRLSVLGVKDLSGEKAETQVKFHMATDGGDGAVGSVHEEDERHLTLEFTQRIVETSAENKSNYSVYDEGGNDVSDLIKSVELLNSRSVEIKFRSYLSGKYVLRVAGVTERDGRIIKDQIVFNMDFDEGPPTIRTIEIVDEDRINVSFSELLDESSATSVNSYRLYDQEGYIIDIDIRRVVMDGDKAVKIYFDEDLGGKYILKASGVKDLTGDRSENEVAFEVDEDGSTPVIDDIDPETGNMISVVFSKAMDGESALDIEHYSLYKEDEEVSNIINKIRQRADDEYLIYFKSNLEGTYTLAVKDAEDRNGNNIDDAVSFDIIPDYEAPSISSIETIDDDEILIVFSEKVDKSSAENKGAYRLYERDGSIVDVDIESASLDSEGLKKVTLIFEDDINGTYKLKVSGVEDLYGNKVTQERNFTMTGDWTAPRIVRLEVLDSETIAIELSEPLDRNSALNENNYRLYDGDGKDVSNLIDDVKLYKEDEVDIVFKEALKGQCVIRMKGVEDLSENPMDDNMDFQVE